MNGWNKASYNAKYYNSIHNKFNLPSKKFITSYIFKNDFIIKEEKKKMIIERIKNRNVDNTLSRFKFKGKLKLKLKLDDIGNPRLLRRIKFRTKKDFEVLKPYDSIIYDKRGFFLLFHTFLQDNHSVYNLIFVNSVMEPLSKRYLQFLIEININFWLSALFFSDDYIDERAELPAYIRVNFYFNLRIHLFIQW